MTYLTLMNLLMGLLCLWQTVGHYQRNQFAWAMFFNVLTCINLAFVVGDLLA